MEENESKDTIDYVYLSDNERYADLFNGVLFGGKQILDATMLEERDSRAVVSKKKSKARDVVRKYGKGATYMVLGVENQEEVSYCMPFRMLQYETAEYAKQVSDVRKRNKNIRKVTAGEYLEKYKKGDKVQPCISLVLFWGTDWDGPVTLQEMLNMDAYDVMMVHGHSKALEEIRENVKEEGGNMSKGLTDWGKKERAEGHTEGMLYYAYKMVARGRLTVQEALEDLESRLSEKEFLDGMLAAGFKLP